MVRQFDSLGSIEILEGSLYGASTQRAVANFNVGNHKIPEAFIRVLGLLKSICATVNGELGLLLEIKAKAISEAALAIFEGDYLGNFPVKIFQTGSCTSTNMNINEVLANLATQKLSSIGLKVHPNDDCNLGQSSNDTMPTVLHVSVAWMLKKNLFPSLENLLKALNDKAEKWKTTLKVGRTHWMDAVPLSLGQEFSGYARQIEKCQQRLQKSSEGLYELALGGTAVGTGLNAHPQFASKVIAALSQKLGIPFVKAKNYFEAQATREDCIELAGSLTTLTSALMKIANDIRVMGSGPRAGFNELILPATQPGSSIMPGKVNPVICEMLIQMSIYVQGLAHSVVLCGRESYFELNTAIPLITYALLESIQVLSEGMSLFVEKCVKGLQVNTAALEHYLNQSLMLITALNSRIGYDKAAMVAKKAQERNVSLKQILLEEKLLSEEEINKTLDPHQLVPWCNNLECEQTFLKKSLG